MDDETVVIEDGAVAGEAVEDASAAAAAGATEESSGATFDEQAALRDLVVQAHPNVVPELIAGDTLEEMLSSVPAAEAAYKRLVESVRPAAVRVPAGGGPRTPAADTAGLSPLGKITYALKNRKQSG